MSTISERVVSLFEGKRHGIQKEFADFADLPATSVNNIIKRGSKIPAEWIIPISRFFDVSEHWLLTGEEDTAQPSKVAPAAFQSHIDPELLQLINQMTDREQVELWVYAKQILKERPSDRGDSEAAV